MQDGDNGIISKLLMFVGGLATAALAALVKILVDRKKALAEAQSISRTADKTAHDMHAADAKEYREMFKQAEDAIRKSRREWMKAEFFIRGMLFKMKQNNVPGWEEDEKQFNAMIAEIEG